MKADGTKVVTVTASVEGFTDGIDTVAITDDEVSALNLSITPPSISENGGNATVTVSRNTEELGELTVNLFSDDTSEATVPATVTIPAGQVSATFTLTAVDDMNVDGTKVVTVTASVEGFTDGVEMLDVIDDEFPTLTLSITPASISENGGNTTVTVSRNTEELEELTVNLSSDDTSEATVPATVTIPAGQVSATFTLTAVDDMKVDGTRSSPSPRGRGIHRRRRTVDITDDEVSTLTLSITPASISENGGTTTVTVSRNTETEPNSPLTLQAMTHPKRPFRQRSPSLPSRFPPPSP